MRIYYAVSLMCLGCGSGSPMTSATGTGGSPSSATTSGSGDCSAGTKACGAACVPIGSPDTGCSTASCEPCSYANATATCAGGACALAACVDGWADCNSDKADGCEAHTATDPAHCGDCATTCALANTSPSCVAGSCKVGSCSTGWGDCNGGSSDGCETNTDTSTASCGGCSKACVSGQGCSGGSCYDCGGFVTGASTGTQDAVGVVFPNAIVWKYNVPHDALITSVMVTVGQGQSYCVVTIYADNSGVPGQILASGLCSGPLKMPKMLMAGGYWIGVSPIPGNGVVQLLTFDSTVYPVIYFDGVQTSPTNPPQSISGFTVVGTCL